MSFNPKNEKKTDTFSIQQTERDPFLGTLERKKRVLKTKSVLKKKPVYSPTITYGGTIQKQNSKNQVFVITINNKQHLVKKGQTVDSVRLIRGNAKHIVVRVKSKTQTIPIK